MCGLLFTSSPAVTRERFASALSLMAYRGPDACGYFRSGECQLGLNRLKVVDLDARSDQPFLSADGRYALVFNGEIYNHNELARQYGIPQRTTSDTEVVVELFARYGPRFLDWLDGMFALVILDTQSLEVFAARDRLGVKPLYMHRTGGTLTAASEISAVQHLVGLTEFDDVGIRQYRKLRTFFNGRTAYRGIEMFPAGHYLQHGRLHQYWSLSDAAQEPPDDDELRGLIEESVHRRAIADVPVGSYLSGGLDSTVISALSHTSDTWTVGFSDCNEFVWGRMAADRIGGAHHEVVIEDDEFVDLAREMIRIRREPLSVPNEVLLYKMTRDVKRANTVVLSGEGADELFFGYDRIFRWAAEAPRWDLSGFASLYAYGSNDDLEIVEDALAPFVHLATPLDVVARFFQVAHLHGLLRRLDFATMLCSVEARVPFVDFCPLIDRMAGVPFAYRMAGGVVKAPLKRVFRDLVPAEILERKKVGFPVPLDQLPLGVDPSLPAMDRWFEFNLQVLGDC